MRVGSPNICENANVSKNKNPFPYKLETGRGLESYFDFPIEPISNLDSSLKKVSIKRTDELI